jgi:ActR/RegA family two-component response regulator
MLEMLTPQLDGELAQRKKKQTQAEQVKWVLKRLLGGPRPEITEVAKELGMSIRTLQRAKHQFYRARPCDRISSS